MNLEYYQKMKNKILVIGDGMLDEYVIGNINRFSPEDESVPIVDVSDKEIRLGGAFNVAANLKTLSKKGTQIFVSSIISEFTADILNAKKINYDEIILKNKNSNLPHERELLKTRIINGTTGKQIVRLDNKLIFDEADIQRYKNKCYYSNFIDFDIIVVSDYNKGIIDQKIIEKLSKTSIPVFVDSKKSDLSIWKNIPKCYVKINSKEFKNSTNAKECEHLIVTKGSEGADYYHKGMLHSFYKTSKIDDADVVGAGDCFLAGLVTAFSEGFELDRCLEFANKVAAASVRELGTVEIKRNEL